MTQLLQVRSENTMPSKRSKGETETRPVQFNIRSGGGPMKPMRLDSTLGL